jgi:hypothetical protein
MTGRPTHACRRRSSVSRPLLKSARATPREPAPDAQRWADGAGTPVRVSSRYRGKLWTPSQK